jgi:hypothetical protein
MVQTYIELEECGCCSCYHRPEFLGDCRDDAERFPTWQVFIGTHNDRPAYLIDDGAEPELFRYLDEEEIVPFNDGRHLRRHLLD